MLMTRGSSVDMRLASGGGYNLPGFFLYRVLIIQRKGTTIID